MAVADPARSKAYAESPASDGPRLGAEAVSARFHDGAGSPDWDPMLPEPQPRIPQYLTAASTKTRTPVPSARSSTSNFG